MFSNTKNIIVGESSNLFAVSPLRFLMLVFLLYTIMSFRAQSRNEYKPFPERELGDSTKIKYDISDPRNPLCPCHEYQKKADEEFAKLQKKESQKDNLSAVSNNDGASSDNSVTKRHRFTFIKFNKRHGSKKFYKIKVVFTKEYWRKWRASTDVANCFNW